MAPGHSWRKPSSMGQSNRRDLWGNGNAFSKGSWALASSLDEDRGKIGLDQFPNNIKYPIFWDVHSYGVYHGVIR